MSGRFKSTANKLAKKLPKNIKFEPSELERFTEFVSIQLDESVKKYEAAGREVMKEKRCTAMSSWLTTKASGRYKAYERAIQFDKSTVKQEQDKIIITIRSYVDTDIFESIFAASSSAYDSIYRWVYESRSYDDPSLHVGHINDGWRGYDYETKESFRGSAIPMPLTIGEYVLNNMWEKGYSALPPRETATGTHWQNPHFKERDSLSEYTERKLNNSWARDVKSKLNTNDN